MQEIDRTMRISELVKRELALIIPRELNDKRINSVTVTAVTVSRDLRQSTIYVSSLDRKLDEQVMEKLLNKSAGYLRYLLSQKMAARTTPALNFKYDSSIEKGIELSTLIDKLNSN